jgi:hypothetical protein
MGFMGFMGKFVRAGLGKVFGTNVKKGKFEDGREFPFERFHDMGLRCEKLFNGGFPFLQAVDKDGIMGRSRTHDYVVVKPGT